MSQQQSQPTIIQQPYSTNKNKYPNPLFSQETHIQPNTERQSPSLNNTKQKNLKPQDNHQQVQKASQQIFYTILDSVDQYDHLIQQMNYLYNQGMMAIANIKFLNPYTSLSTKGFKPTPAITKISVDQDRLWGQKKDSVKSQSQKQAHSIQQQKINCNQNEISNEKDVISKKKCFTLIDQSKNNHINFTYSVIQSINRIYDMEKNQNNAENTNAQYQQEYDQDMQEHISQSAHSSRSTAHNLYSYEEQELIVEEEQVSEDCRKLINQNKGKENSKQQFLLERFNIESQKVFVCQAMRHFETLLQKLLQIAQLKIEIQNKFNIIESRQNFN